MRYFAELKPFLADMRRAVAERVRPMLAELVARHAARTDAMPAGRRAQSIMAGIAHKMTREWPNERLHAKATEIGRAVSKFQKDQLFRQTKAALGIEVGSIVDRGIAARISQFASENVALIRSVQTRYLGEVERVVLGGISNGARAADIADELADRFEVAESNALRIARDQIGKLNGQLNSVRQQALGIEGFTWRTMHDNRVREEHADLDGQRFSWDDPPAEGIPGEPINCRCFASPDFAGLLEGE